MDHSRQEYLESDGATLFTNDPGIKAALEALNARWPWTLSRQELVDAVHARLVAAGFTPDANLADHVDGLMEVLIAQGQVQYRLDPIVPEPAAAPLRLDRPVRRMAELTRGERDASIFNLWHEPLLPSPVDRHLLPLLDGTRDRDALLDALLAIDQESPIELERDGEQASGEAERREAMAEHVDTLPQRLGGDETPAGRVTAMLPPDNHVHSEFSWDTGVNASMEQTCQRAVEVGLPAVAFTEHVDFTAWGVHDKPPAGGQAATAEIARRLRVQPLDVDGYLASIETCRARFPALRILSGIEAGEPHHFEGSVAAVLRQGRFDRVLGSLHSIVHDGQLVYADHVFKFVAPDVRRAGLLRRVVAPGREFRRLPGPRTLRLPAPLLADQSGRGVSRSGLRGGVPNRLPRAGHVRPGTRAQHQQSARIGHPDAVVVRRGR